MLGENERQDNQGQDRPREYFLYRISDGSPATPKNEQVSYLLALIDSPKPIHPKGSRTIDIYNPSEDGIPQFLISAGAICREANKRDINEVELREKIRSLANRSRGETN